ncbi:hypothetical protein KCP73_06470 [Salmonella enterica subsp. enterica]|nr:hypothetical protein KCP73_06470 [Salmonella enterica subsp. enterica]
MHNAGNADMPSGAMRWATRRTSRCRRQHLTHLYYGSGICYGRRLDGLTAELSTGATALLDC